MDKVTQSSAANAEESASASEELSSQAAELKNMVNVLVNIVGESGAGNNNAGPSGTVKPAVSHVTHAVPKRKTLAKVTTKVVSPDDVIPLDDEDFGEF